MGKKQWLQGIHKTEQNVSNVGVLFTSLFLLIALQVQDRAPHYSGGRGAAAFRGAGRGGSSMYIPQTSHLGRSPASVAGKAGLFGCCRLSGYCLWFRF